MPFKMMDFENTEEREPLGYFRGYPIHVATLLAVVHAAAMVVCGLLLSARLITWLNVLPLATDEVLHNWQLWRPISYVFLHIPGSPGTILSYILQFWILFSLGREVERFMGRKFFIWLYVGLVLMATVVVVPLSFVFGPQVVADSDIVHVSMCIAFAVIYPSVQFFFSIRAKTIAALLLFAYTLYYIAQQQFAMIVLLWASAALSYYVVRAAGVGDGLNLFAGLRERFTPAPRPKAAKVKSLSRSSGGDDADAEDAVDSVDSVLEKISKQGIGSLTQSERAKLERARVSLLNRKKDRAS